MPCGRRVSLSLFLSLFFIHQAWTKKRQRERESNHSGSRAAPFARGPVPPPCIGGETQRLTRGCAPLADSGEPARFQWVPWLGGIACTDPLSFPLSNSFVFSYMCTYSKGFGGNALWGHLCCCLLINLAGYRVPHLFPNDV